jgi:prolyl 4-hydroxylase
MDFVYQIDNLLTPEECQKYMDMFKNKGDVENIDDKHRKYHRVQFNDQELADKLYEKVKSYLSNKIKIIADGMNEHIRLSMYDPKQFFGIHKDGTNFDKNNKQRMSYATLNIFLNDNFEGGATTFYEKDKSTVKFVCKPKMGSGAFFYSQQFHEGNKIISGHKFLIRTDFMINHNKK